tara:strand:+ start:2243 stop:3127 length:885 start_codon:yes stop_codon:yes gene_type:complete
MSKIKVDSIESSNQNVKLTPNGTGVVEVKGAGGADGTLKLTSSDGTNGVKLKSPPHSANQSQTLILPDNSPTQDQFLKVKSVTGSAPNKVAQLEYASVATPDITQLDASNVTTGTLDATRFPSPLSPTAAGLKLISYSQVPASTSVNNVDITNLEDNSRYLIVLDGINFSNNSVQGLYLYLLKENGSQWSNGTIRWYTKYWSTYTHATSDNGVHCPTNSNGSPSYSYIITLYTPAANGWVHTMGYAPGIGSNSNETYASFTDLTSRIYGVRIEGYSYGGVNQFGKIYTYKYLSS